MKSRGQDQRFDRGREKKPRWLDAIAEVDPAAWNAIAGDSPFLRYEFLAALERNACLVEYGWQPRHIIVENQAGELLAAAPMYIKHNSYGEFVFDWSWASAYQRAGLPYYPKFVCAVPYTPAMGPRLLVRSGPDAERLRSLLVDTAIGLAAETQLSGVHWLFTEPGDTEFFDMRGMSLRLGCQYHWRNEGYRDFDDYLDRFISRKRKKLKRERERVREQGITLRVITGAECDADLWLQIHRYYEHTFEVKSGVPTLTLGFFLEVARTMGDRIVLVLAERAGRLLACAINFRSKKTLYGRFWGSLDAYHSLHFEACYYQGLEYCLREGLETFEPGAQGEHKIARGFLPVRTWSAHWISEPNFRGPIHAFCEREREAMQEQCEELAAMSPFRDDTLPSGAALSPVTDLKTG